MYVRGYNMYVKSKGSNWEMSRHGQVMFVGVLSLLVSHLPFCVIYHLRSAVMAFEHFMRCDEHACVTLDKQAKELGLG